MNALATGNLDQVCADLGIGRSRMMDHRLDFANDVDGVTARLDAHAAQFQTAKLDAPERQDSTTRRDGIANFVTNGLATLLTPVIKPGLERFLFVPGRTGPAGPLLPVRRTMELGKNTVEWDVIAYTGEARQVGMGGTKGLTRVGEGADRKGQPNIFYGVRFGWDQWDLWRGPHLGRNVQMERAKSGRQAMAEFAEFTGGYGLDESKVPGFFNHGASYTLDLAKSFGDVTLTADEMWEQLSIIDLAWDRANPNRAVSGIVMPKTHYLRMLRIFKGTNKEGVNAWQFALAMFPWLSNIVQDDRMLTASQDGGPMWQMWSSAPDLLWREAGSAPMMFGPFNDELNTDFILLEQDGGVVNRLAQLIFRINQPA